MRFLVQSGQYSWKTYGKPIDRDSLLLLTEAGAPGLKRARTTAEKVLEVYDDLCTLFAVDPAATDVIRTLAEKWLEQRVLCNSWGAFHAARSRTI